MLQTFLEIVKAHPGTAAGTGIGALILSEILGFTRKGGILKGLLDLVIAAGAAALAFKRAHNTLDNEKVFDQVFRPPKQETPPE